MDRPIVLLVAFLCSFGLTLAALFTLQRKLRALAEGFLKALSGKTGAVPSRIHLEPLGSVSFSDQAAADALAEQWRARGLTEILSYTVQEIDGVRLRAFVHPREGYHAVLTEHPKAGSWVEYVARFQDGTRLGTGNSPSAGAIDLPPHIVSMPAPGADPLELLDRFVAALGDKPRVPITADNFAALYEQGYAEVMDWRNARGGATADEIRRVAALSGKEVDEQTVARTQEVTAERAGEGLNAAVLDAWRAASGLSPAEWSELADRLVPVHDRLTLASVVGQLAIYRRQFQAAGFDMIARLTALQEDFGEGAEPTTRACVARLMEAIPPEVGFSKLGDLDEPVPADIYLAPPRS